MPRIITGYCRLRQWFQRPPVQCLSIKHTDRNRLTVVKGSCPDPLRQRGDFIIRQLFFRHLEIRIDVPNGSNQQTAVNIAGHNRSTATAARFPTAPPIQREPAFHQFSGVRMTGEASLAQDRFDYFSKLGLMILDARISGASQTATKQQRADDRSENHGDYSGTAALDFDFSSGFRKCHATSQSSDFRSNPYSATIRFSMSAKCPAP